MKKVTRIAQYIKQLISLSLFMIAGLGFTISCSSTRNPSTIICNSYDCIEINKNKKATVVGVLCKSSILDWEWKILFKDSSYIYINSTGSKLIFNNYENQKVSIEGTIFYGVVRGENDGKSSFAIGYRFDPTFIEIYK